MIDFLFEQHITMKFWRMNDSPSTTNNCIQTWQDEHCYYIAVDRYNADLFGFIKNKHEKELVQYHRNSSIMEQKSADQKSEWTKTCIKL